MAVFNKIYNLESMPRATPILELALNTIKFGDKPTPRDAVVILRNPIERRKFLAKYQDQLDEASHESWGEFESMSSGQDALADPVVRRLRRFYSTNFMYAMFCHPDSLDFVQLIKQNKIILVSLEVDKAKVPPSEQQLLGALIVSQIELAARKAGKPKPVDFRLYVDEAKNFIATSLPDLFDEIR